MGGHGFRNQGLGVRTLYVDHAGAGNTLTKYTEVWVTGDAAIVAGAPAAIRATGLWIGIGLPAGNHSHASLEFGIGVRNQLCGPGTPHPLPGPPAALPNPTPIATSREAQASLTRAFGAPSPWLKQWLGFEVLAPDLKKVPIPVPPSSESLFFKWQVRNFSVPTRVAFFPAAIVATQRPKDEDMGPGTGFEQNFTLGLSLLTGKKVAVGTDIDYFEIDAHTFL